MIYAAIGGMQLKHWTDYFKIIGPTIRVLFQAKKSTGCVQADMFKAGNVYFAISVWNDENEMLAFAQNGLHGALMKQATSSMAMFHNYTHMSDEVLPRDEMVSLWHAEMKRRDGKGSVGQLRMASREKV